MSISTRSKGRALALMALFAIDGVPSFEVEDTLETFWRLYEYRQVWDNLFVNTGRHDHPLDEPPIWDIMDNLPLTRNPQRVLPALPAEFHQAREFANERIQGVLQKRRDVDAAISLASKKWRIQRMTRLDRSLLRLGAYELLYTPDVPGPVVINEAIELCKRYSSVRAPSFINGILDRVRRNQRAKASKKN